MLIGTLIGDALGGPFEFQPKETWSKLPHPPKIWQTDEVLDAKAMVELRQRVQLQSYRHLRPLPEPYAHWSTNAAPGTITEDSRHKIILLHALPCDTSIKPLKRFRPSVAAHRAKASDFINKFCSPM